uniref:Hes family bHLH transcription factor 1 n=2 Tax=Macaca TaxID=9539 RepID=A0A7N9D2B3_MACFA
MPADIMEKNSSSPVAATPASVNTTPDKPKTASEHRKSSKPIMEKRRRARINESLSQLKTLILDALKKDSSRHSKLEKADILEMTVKHLRNLQRAQMTAALSTDPSVLGKYRAGFSECMNEVTRFLSTCEGVNTEVRTRLLGHLANCMTQINAMTYPGQPHPALQAPPPPPPGPGGPQHAPFAPPPPLVPIPGARRPLPAAHPASWAARLERQLRCLEASRWYRLPMASLLSSFPTGPSRTAALSSRSTPATAAPPWAPTQCHLPAAPRLRRTPCGGRGGTEGAQATPPPKLPNRPLFPLDCKQELEYWERKGLF